MSLTLTNEQTRSLFEIRVWFQALDQPFWRLAGLAGTGKTSLMKFLLEVDDLRIKNKEIAVVAFTHTAASVLRKKGVHQAKTVHSLIYKCEKLPNGEYFFIRRTPRELQDLYCLIVVDEASMIGYQMRQDLLSFGIPVLFVGDAGQLE